MNGFITLDEYAHKSENLKLMAEDNECFPISFIHQGYIHMQSPTCHITHIIYPIKRHTCPGLIIDNKKGVKDVATKSTKTLSDKIEQ